MRAQSQLWHGVCDRFPSWHPKWTLREWKSRGSKYLILEVSGKEPNHFWFWGPMSFNIGYLDLQGSVCAPWCELLDLYSEQLYACLGRNSNLSDHLHAPTYLYSDPYEPWCIIFACKHNICSHDISQKRHNETHQTLVNNTGSYTVGHMLHEISKINDKLGSASGPKRLHKGRISQSGSKVKHK